MRFAAENFVPRRPVVDLEGVGGPPAVVGVDFDQQPWPSHPTLEHAFHEYLIEHVIPRGGDVRRTSIASRSWLVALEPQFDVSKITRADGRRVVKHDLDHGRKGATARRNMAMGIAALNHAFKEERIKGVPKFALPDASSARLRWLTPEEVRRLIQSPKPARIHRFFIVAFGTGVRSEAIEEATWDRVDFNARTIDFRVPGAVYRNKRRPIAPINDELLPRLRSMYERRTDDYVIGLGSRGTPSCTYQGCKTALERIGICEPGVARHVARHTFCSWRVQAGFSYAHIGALVGDTAHMIEATYGHLAPEHMREAANLALLS